MNYITIDIETTGLPANFNGMITDSANWPRVVQLGFVVTDQHGTEMHSSENLIRPDGWIMGATHIHGITQEQAQAKGITIATALTKLTSWAHTCRAIVCHNVDFDLPILQAEYYRAGLLHCYKGKLIYCTQKQTTTIVKIRKPQRGFQQSGYKWPSLKELAEFCGIEYGDDAHTALADARVTAKCFHFLQDLHPTAFDEAYYYKFLNETIGHQPSGKPGCKSYII